MIQQVNLYTDELRPRRELLQARTAGASLIVLLAFLALLGGFARWEYSSALEEQRAVQRQVELLQDKLSGLQQTIAERQEDPDLVDAMRSLDREVRQRREVLSQVETLVITDGRHFSVYLEALARQTLEGLWLNTIDLGRSASDIRLTGSARVGERVPHYLQRLSTEPAFSGSEFHSFTLGRAVEGTLINFSVATDDAQSGGERAHGS